MLISKSLSTCIVSFLLILNIHFIEIIVGGGENGRPCSASSVRKITVVAGQVELQDDSFV